MTGYLRHLLAIMISIVSIGAHAVGYERVTAPDPAGAALELGIWYPSQATTAPLVLGPITQNVAQKAALDGPKTLPLIVISHGTGGSNLGHYDTAIALAQAGYIVAAVTHTGDNYRDQSRSMQILDRPRQISRVLDYLLVSWPNHDRIDASRIGMFGHSAGGFTTLVSVGGVPDLAQVKPFCSEPRHAADFACQLIAQDPQAAGLTPPAGSGENKDIRIKAAVVVAPALGFAFSPGGLRAVTVPIDLWRAERDTLVPHPWYAEAVRQALPNEPTYHVVPNAGHFDFLAPCSAALAALAPPICTSAPDFDRAAFHTSFNAAVAGFFDKTLR